MSLNLDWSLCRDIELLNTEPERWVSFACGVIMSHADICRITDDTLPELMVWQGVVEDGSCLIFINGEMHPLTVEDWIRRLGMSANVRSETVAKRRTALHKRLLLQKIDEIKVARCDLEEVSA